MNEHPSRCPTVTEADWRRIAASGDDFLEDASEGRAAILAHLADCPSCASEALRLDPSLAVANLGVEPATRSEIDEIKRGVEALRKVARVRSVRDATGPDRAETATGRLRDGLRQVRGHGARWLAAAASLAALLLLVPGSVSRLGDGERRDEAAGVNPPSVGVDLQAGNPRSMGSLLFVESLYTTQTRVYQLGQDDLSLIWIVDESLDF